MSANRRRLRPAVILDRDGVINVSPGDGFVASVLEFRFIPGTFWALRKLHQRGMVCFVVSNQSGVGRGIFSKKQLALITRRMCRKIRNHDGRIDGVAYCLHAPDMRCGCRKPKTKMIRDLAKRFSLDLKRSFVVGDAAGDIEMGRRTGCQTILVLSGKTSPSAARKMHPKPTKIFKNLKEAVHWITR